MSSLSGADRYVNTKLLHNSNGLDVDDNGLKVHIVARKDDLRPNDDQKANSTSKTWKAAKEYFEGAVEIASDYASKASSYIPFVGTYVGCKHALALLYRSEMDEHQGADTPPVGMWEKAKVVTEIFSFLFIPQVCYGIANGVDYLMDLFASKDNNPPKKNDMLSNY